MQNNNFLVSPGESIQVPDLPHPLLRSIILQKYGLQAETLSRLPGYDDLNYRLRSVCASPTSSALPPPTSDLMLKFTNPIESKIDGLIEGQVAFCRQLFENGIPCPEIIPRLDGKFWGMETVKPEDGPELELPLRMFSFLQGEVIQAKMVSPGFLRQVGDMLARIHEASQGFHHPVYDSYKTHWSLSCAPLALKFAYTLDEEKQKLVKESIKPFQDHVLPKEDEFPQGQIHGDLNESNMLALPGPTPESDYTISGILDLWDNHRTCYLYDVALSITYLMLLDSPSVPLWDVGAHILRGYLDRRKLSEAELKAIPPCIPARFVQSLIYGHYTNQLNPENTYALNTQAAGWRILRKIADLPQDFLHNHWKQMLN